MLHDIVSSARATRPCVKASDSDVRLCPFGNGAPAIHDRIVRFGIRVYLDLTLPEGGRRLRRIKARWVRQTSRRLRRPASTDGSSDERRNHGHDGRTVKGKSELQD